MFGKSSPVSIYSCQYSSVWRWFEESGPFTSCQARVCGNLFKVSSHSIKGLILFQHIRWGSLTPRYLPSHTNKSHKSYMQIKSHLHYFCKLHPTFQPPGLFSGKCTFSWSVCLFMTSQDAGAFFLSVDWATHSHQYQRKSWLSSRWCEAMFVPIVAKPKLLTAILKAR